MKPVLLLIPVISILPLHQATKSIEAPSLTPQAILNYRAPMLNLPGKPAGGMTATDTNQLKQSGWYAAAMKSMERKEYEFSRPGDSGTYTTPNRKNNLRFYYNEKGFSVQPRTTQIPNGKITAATKPGDIKYKPLPNWQVAFNLDKKQIGEGVWQVAANKAEYKTGNVTVQYINNEEGMRQNFIVRSPLSTGDLKLHFSIETGLQIQLQRDRLQFTHDTSGVVLNYDQLKVWDANGKPLEAVFEKDNHDYCIHVQSKNAAYPITIDPISATPTTMLEIDQDFAMFGCSVASAGDVNGDGYSDVIVGAYNYDNGESNEGAAFIYYGSATGIGTTAAAIVESNQSDAGFGTSVAGAGDINGDGYSDVIVGAPNYGNGQLYEGAAFIYHGSAAGIGTTAVFMVEGNQDFAFLGWSVAGAGDVNGDGYNDVIVGEFGYSNGENYEGAAFIYHGSATGISTTAATIAESNQGDAQLGISVACAGDVNGDGYSDVIVGAYNYSNGENYEGAAFIYHGSASGINTTAATTVESNQADALLGSSVAGAGDVNGDGYSDVIVGVSQYSNGETNEGAAFIYQGSVTGINNTATAIVESNQANALFGNSVAGAGDVNGDGYSDVIVGEASYDNGETDEGAVFIYEGSATGISTTVTAMFESNQPNTYLGTSVACAGDVNADGFSDLIAGASAYSNGQSSEGAAFIYHGSASGITAAIATMVESDQAGAFLGYSVASAGDVNGDGYSDVIVGAYLYDNGENDEGAAFIYYGSATGLSTTTAAIVESNQVDAWLGWSVAGAGDVNGDGYSDVIVGANQYHNGENNEGVAFIYYGSASGINTTAAAMVESNQADAMLGYSVAGAGDVNGDGYSDVIVGAPNYDNGENNEGAAFIYHGSATGISTTAATMEQSNQADASMGYSVAGAGDVNGDGYSDVIVGASYYDNGQTDEGAVFVYHGSASGVGATAVLMVEGNQDYVNWGFSVAGAGDINGDGYSDVIMGTPYYDLGNNNAGAAFIYYGSASGINTGSVVTLARNLGNTYFGYLAAGAGDVNSDGYSDVVVSDMGTAVLIFEGSASGINTTAASTIDNSQINTSFGYWVAGAGDVNGDGFSDVIAGNPTYYGGETGEGAAFVYYGNSAGKRNNLDLYNADLSTPINSSNFPGSTFGAGLYAKSITGAATKGKLVWETEVSYQSYSGTPITNSVLYTGMQNSYTSLGSTPVQLTNVMAKQLARYTKVRARVKYNFDAVTALTGQVYGPWRYATDMAYLTLNTLPVNLISFKAAWVSKGKTAQLTFITDNESEVCCYHIEKSSDGVNFTTIGNVAAKNTTGQITYCFTDNNAVGTKLYYRLQTVFTTGTTEYSNIQWLQNNSATEIIAFPNPAANVLQLRLNGNYASMNVQIINSAGQMVKQFSNLTAAGQLITIPVNDLAAGTYFLNLQSGNEKQVLQFVKQ